MSHGCASTVPPRLAIRPMPVNARPAPRAIVPCAWTQRSARTTGSSESTAARRALRANGSRMDGTNRATASTMCVPSSTGKRSGIAGRSYRRHRLGRGRPSDDKGDPIAFDRPVRDVQPSSPERVADVRLAIDEDPGRDEGPTGSHLDPQVRSEAHEKTRDEVRHDDLVRSVATRETPETCTNPTSDPVAPRVRARRLDCDRVGVDAMSGRRAELDRRDREDARPAPDIEHAATIEIPGIREPFEGREAQPRGRVQPRPERHPGIEGDDDVVGFPPMAPPRGSDHDPIAYPQHGKIGLPRVRPVLLVHDARPQIADPPEPERLEVSERLACPF